MGVSIDQFHSNSPENEAGEEEKFSSSAQAALTTLIMEIFLPQFPIGAARRSAASIPHSQVSHQTVFTTKQ